MPAPQDTSAPLAASGALSWLYGVVRTLYRLLGLTAATGVLGVLVLGIGMAVAWPSLPDISDLAHYQPKLPLRVYSVEGALLGEFGEERRNLTPIEEIPPVMINALLAIEDARFFRHGGIDYKGLLRAALANLKRSKSQGASTITMQVARNVYLSSEKTLTRKLYEILLTLKLEHSFTKNQILEIYMNQIYLGNRAYGFAAAAEIYFGKPLKNLSIAEAAMLAGLPKAPSEHNPLRNPNRARTRQTYIIDRMVFHGFITPQEAVAAKQEDLKLRSSSSAATAESTHIHAEYVAEMARQLVFAQYGEEAYTRGLHVYTTLNAGDQESAYMALRKGIMDYERRQRYRGPENFVTLPTDPAQADEAVDKVLIKHPDNGEVLAAVVLEVNNKKIVAARPDGEHLEITGDGLTPAQSGLSNKAPPHIKLRRGAVIRVVQTPKKTWEITQLPEVEGAFVALDPHTGAIRALVGGFDFNKNKFNHVTQAWRQPGSSFKPFIYSAALENGFTPATLINDAPLYFGPEVTGGKPWVPKNFDGKFDGPMTLRVGMARSRNVMAVRVLQTLGPKTAQKWATLFGFDAERHPPYLTLALGAGSVTPMQMATAYSVFANGGYRIQPYLITHIADHKGRVLSQTTPAPLTENTRAISARNAFIMDSLLQEVTRSGTAARAQATLKRRDLYGKTGTTNDAVDTWFAGFQPTLTAVTWIGYDTPRKLGNRETGGVLSLPVWINFMQHALKEVPVAEPTVPPGVVNVGGEWFYEEHVQGGGITSLGLDEDTQDDTNPLHPAPERNEILDLFRH